MILALETSSSLCAVCVADASTGSVLAEVSHDIGRGHAERLIDDTAEALKLAGLRYGRITSIAACVGPGSFTGIRVGVAAARGFGLALSLPVHGVTGLQAIAWQAREMADGRAIIVALDAGRDEIHTQTFTADALPVSAPEAVLSANFLISLPSGPALICGSAVNLLQPEAFPKGTVSHPSALISTSAAVAFASAFPQMTVPPKPVYLRAPDAKTQAGFAIARAGP